MDFQKPVHTIVLDTGPILKNDPSLNALLQKSERLITVPTVIAEIKDPNTRSRVETILMPFLEIRSPSTESLKVITDFARKTGDLAVLSKPDIQVLALAYEIECEKNGGDWRLRRVPGQKGMNGPLPGKGDGEPDQPNSTCETQDKGDGGSSDIRKTEIQARLVTPKESQEELVGATASSVQSYSHAVQTNGIVSDIQQLQISSSGPAQSPVIGAESSKPPPRPETPPEPSDLDSSDSDGWITPSNVKKHQAKDMDSATAPIPDDVKIQVATITTDFAMQNVLLQMNLNLLSTSLQRVKKVKTWIRRCHACFEKTKDMSKQFCSRCGKPTLTRVSCTVNQSGKFTLHLKKNMQWNHRGDRFSIPKPVPGAANGKFRQGKGGGRGGWGQRLILAEDQKEYLRAMNGQSRRKEKNLMDEDYLPGILTGDRGWNSGRPKIGGGRNINSKGYDFVALSMLEIDLSLRRNWGGGIEHLGALQEVELLSVTLSETLAPLQQTPSQVLTLSSWTKLLDKCPSLLKISNYDTAMIVAIVAGACLVWYFFILTVCAIGFFQIQRNYSSPPHPPVSPTLPLVQIPHVTILRPVKGLEPHLYECLAATFHQSYPPKRLTIYFCISFRDDPAFPILERLLHDFPGFDAKILIEEEDPNLSGHNGNINNLGPNPKIRNMSRGYREAKGDILWIIDCNVWTGPQTVGNMVDLLCGFVAPNTPISQRKRKYKFVHQLPLVIEVSSSPSSPSPSTHNHRSSLSGGHLEEIFLSTSHAKFYTAISRVAIAPCIVGKSNMFRLSHLNALTSNNPLRSPGIDYFSDNICEDHLIGDLLWRSPVPRAVRTQVENEVGFPRGPMAKWGNHALLPRSLAIQPVAYMPLSSYLNRRIRWLRVRKFTVTLATLVEPGTESLLCSCYGAFGLTTHPLCTSLLHSPRTWPTFLLIWLASVTCWMLLDYLIWRRLQSGQTLSKDKAPAFTRRRRRPWTEWVGAWVGREVLALPVWVWAVAGGVTVVWRGRRFWVGVDMKVHEIGGEGKGAVVSMNGNGTEVGGKRYID